MTVGAEPPGGCRREAQRKPKRLKLDANLKKSLDSPVGSIHWLGGFLTPARPAFHLPRPTLLGLRIQLQLIGRRPLASDNIIKKALSH